MSAEKPLSLHEFHSPNQLPLSWNSIYGALTLIDNVGFPSPVGLEVGSRGSGIVKVCLSPSEAKELGTFLGDYSFTVINGMAEIARKRGGDPKNNRYADGALSGRGDFMVSICQPIR